MSKNNAHIIRDMPFADYQARPGINSSSLSDIDPKRRDAGSPAKYYHNHVLGNAEPFDSEALRFGRAFHSYVLTPKVFKDEYAIESEKLYQSILDRANAEQKAAKRKPSEKFSKNLKAWKDYKASIEEMGGELLSADSYHQIQEMASHEQTYVLESPHMEFEISIFHELMGMNCKARLDAYDPSTNTIYDLKTISEWNPGGSIAQWSWHRQAAFYTDLAIESGLAKPGCKFAWVFCKKSPPYEALCHTCEPEILEAGRDYYRELLATIHECRNSGEWPGPGITYPYGLQKILKGE
tara:strand:+ start:274 stop:1158 length:885 start_codon:yes stop_codon:yes gene_type:complete